MLTSLRGADGQVYAVAQGPVMTGGFSERQERQFADGESSDRGPRSRARPSWSAAAPSVAPKGTVRLQLNRSDFTTTTRIVEAVNQKFRRTRPLAHAENAGLVSVAVPAEYATRATEFISALENLSVEADRPARVVINERTGTIVLGKDVRISPVAILHGNLSVEIQTVMQVSQPDPMARARPKWSRRPASRRRKRRRATWC